MKINKAFIHTIKGIAIGLVLVVGISYVQAAWAPPTGAPSEGNNAPAPINVSSSNQAKEGWLLVGGTGAPLSQFEVSNAGDTAQGTLDMALVTKTSRFVQTAKFGNMLTDAVPGKVNVVGAGSKVNVGYSDTGILAEGPEELNVKGNLLSTELENEGPGLDITLKGVADDWYPTMLCADTNGKIILCRDLPDVPYVDMYEPISIDLTLSDVAEFPLPNGCDADDVNFSTSISGTDDSPSYSWTITKTAGTGAGTLWSPATPSGSAPSVSLFRHTSTMRTFSITVTATDDEGNTDSDTVTKNVQSISWYETNELGGGAMCPD